MALSLEPVLNAVRPLGEKAMALIRRDAKPRDAFGGDDLFDGDPKEANLGPKIAMGVSGVLLLGVIGIITTVVMMGGEAPPTAGGSLADIEFVDDPSAASSAATAASDRSVERRPWLTNAAPTGSRLMGVDDSTSTSDENESAPGAGANKPFTPGSLPTQSADAAPAMAPPPSQPAKPAPAAPMPSEIKSPADLLAMVKSGADATSAPTPPPVRGEPAAQASMANAVPAAETKLVEAKPVEAKPSEARPAAGSMPVAESDHETSVDEKQGSEKQAPVEVAKATPPAMPEIEPAPEPKPENSLAPPGVAPGAPARIKALADADAGPVNTGGRPRLVDPRMPPIEKSAINAPPPRYAALTNVATDALPDSATSAAKVAVIVEGLGLNQAATEAAINKLPRGVTLAFSPYARNLKAWLERAKAAGHEVLVEVPMESKAFPADDPGPLGLLTMLPDEDNTKRLDAILTEAAGVSGIYDRLGSKFRESESDIDLVLGKLKEKNLFYVQGRPGIRVGAGGVPMVAADVVIDERAFRAALDARLDYTEQLAKYQGSVVAVMSPRPIAFERLTLWMDQLKGKDIALAPVSQVLIQ